MPIATFPCATPPSTSVRWPDGTALPAIGQGTWRMGERPAEQRAEIAALQHGLERGLTLIDTAEMYGDGGAEIVVGKALQGRRDRAFVVNKVYPHHASRRAMRAACERSLKRLGIDTIDCYLLHWASATPIDEIIEGFMHLQAEGKIRGYGVSNLDDHAMSAWWQHRNGPCCQTNQVLYHLGSRGIEYRLLPLLQQHQLPLMAYCPLAQGGRLHQRLMQSPAVVEVAKRHSVTPVQVLLAWTIRAQRGQRSVIAIPKAATPSHIDDNAAALTLSLEPGDLALLDHYWPAPAHRVPLDIE